MILMFWAQHRVKATYEKYAEIQSSLGMTSRQSNLRKICRNSIEFRDDRRTGCQDNLATYGHS